MIDTDVLRTILLVDDETLVTMSERSILEREGYRVRTAPTGEDAITAIADGSIDLVLMDIDLGPGMSGTDAAKTIVSRRDIPIVFFTNHSDEETVARIHEITRYGYVLKTSGRRVLLEVIRLAFELHDEHRELERSRDLFRSVANLTGDIIVRHDADGNWVYLNDAAYHAWGLPRIDPAQLNYLDYVRAEDLPATKAAAEQMRRDRVPVRGLVNRVDTPTGPRVYEWNSAPIIDAGGTYRGFQSTGRDITEQKENETRITELLKERDLLLHEIHHRVKNDLNFVYSLLSLQSDRAESKKARRALTEAGDRIRVIMRVYDLLIHRASKGSVSLKPLIESLVGTVTSGNAFPSVRVSTSIIDRDVSVRQSIALGIIVNELVTNAMKYAYSEKKFSHVRDAVGHIAVAIDESKESSELAIHIRDDGRGFPREIVEGSQRGFGLTVVDSLVSQYSGTLTLKNDDGAVVCASISLESH